jgi:hypothetical protein
VPATPSEPAKDECYRCGYDLRGIANDYACPECGLLAERSRRVTDELHQTRPRWLRSLSWGINLILLAVFAPLAGDFIADLLWRFVVGPWLASTSLPGSSWLWYNWSQHASLLGFDLSAVLLLAGVILLTRREGYPPADRADRKLRIALRLAATVPVLAMLVLHTNADSGYWFFSPYGFYLMSRDLFPNLVALAILFSTPLPLLLFLRLRGLAGRARSAHLAEHCRIVGIGASATTLYVALSMLTLYNAPTLGLGTYWMGRSREALWIVDLLAVASCLFMLWYLYLLVRFAIAFRVAARNLRRTWTRDDRSLRPPP